MHIQCFHFPLRMGGGDFFRKIIKIDKINIFLGVPRFFLLQMGERPKFLWEWGGDNNTVHITTEKHEVLYLFRVEQTISMMEIGWKLMEISIDDGN